MNMKAHSSNQPINYYESGNDLYNENNLEVNKSNSDKIGYKRADFTQPFPPSAQ
jgi:hypothetical protein